MITTSAPSRAAGRRVGVTAVVAASVDWGSKAFATVTLDDGPVSVGSLLTLRLGHNPGMAFGLGDSLPAPLLLGVTTAVTVALGVLAVRGHLGPWWAAGLVLGGAAANVADRAVGGSVVDFLDLGWWPSFNLADVFLTVGCVLLVVVSLRTPES